MLRNMVIKDSVNIAPEDRTCQKKKQDLPPDAVAKYRGLIANGNYGWGVLLDNPENPEPGQVGPGQEGTVQEMETQHVLRFSDEKTVSEVNAIINELPADIRKRLAILGAGLAEDLVNRYGQTAPSILRKNCMELEPRDPVIQVDIKSGAVIFDHLDEFRNTPWGVSHPRAGSLVSVMSGFKGYKLPESTQEAE